MKIGQDSGAYELRDSKGNVIIRGFHSKDGNPDGKWEYFDHSGNLIEERSYNNNKLELIKFFSFGNLIYIQRHYLDSIQGIAFGAEPYSGGEYILTAKCYSCHGISTARVAPSIRTLVAERKLVSVDSFHNHYIHDKNELDSSHQNIELTKFEIAEILKYLEHSSDVLPKNE